MDENEKEKNLKKELLGTEENQKSTPKMFVNLLKEIDDYLDCKFETDPDNLMSNKLLERRDVLRDLMSSKDTSIIDEVVRKAWLNLYNILEDFKIDSLDKIVGVESLVKVIKSAKKQEAPQLNNKEKGINIHYPNNPE